MLNETSWCVSITLLRSMSNRSDRHLIAPLAFLDLGRATELLMAGHFNGILDQAILTSRWSGFVGTLP